MYLQYYVLTILFITYHYVYDIVSLGSRLYFSIVVEPTRLIRYYIATVGDRLLVVVGNTKRLEASW